ncbi:major facilitator superfamily domain-containing protein [Plectosphaerella plurivora]|uniref:Major facilitator superfamily domain-containing protein n=1 Tax=Plectosphaerella plurivora TaxID=936078 RepID=A0A9P8V7R6_9PEZI|nr:major facilitator superfamily domain-containing protein [Plectosphaerella plurivora]
MVHPPTPPRTPQDPQTLEEGPPTQTEKVDYLGVVNSLEDVDLDRVDDSDLVDWDGLDDPENPRNWSTTKKLITVTLLCLFTYLASAASTITAYATHAMGRSFGLRSRGPFEETEYFTDEDTITSIFFLGYFLGAVLIAPLAELHGRSPYYRSCAVFFAAFNIACALSQSIDTIIIFRLITGIVASCPLILGPGTVADMFPAGRRSVPMAAYVVSSMLGTLCGTVSGGSITTCHGWEWCFWTIAILAAVISFVMLFATRESNPRLVLQNKVARLRRETGNVELHSPLDSDLNRDALILRSFSRPWRILGSPAMIGLSLHATLIYSCFHFYLAWFAPILPVGRKLPLKELGIAIGIIIGLGVAELIGVALCVVIINRVSARLTARRGGEAQPEYRLPIMILGTLFVITGLFWWGWSVQNTSHRAMILIGAEILEGGTFLTYLAFSLYVVDAFPSYAASAMAAAMIPRALFGFLSPLFDKLKYDIGLGWASSVLAFLAFVFISVPILYYRPGHQARRAERQERPF